MINVIDVIKTRIRSGASIVARQLDAATNGRVTPDMVTYAGLAMHVPIAWAIAFNHNYWAAGLLLVFGLFDTLDGELARYQKRSGPRGMLLDASTDRFKEVLLYTGAAYALAHGGNPSAAVWAVAAAGASICVSYVEAKGEAVVATGAGKAISHTTLNRMFADGLLTFELRMTLLIIGLLIGQLAWTVAVIAVLASVTAVQRLIRISRQL